MAITSKGYAETVDYDDWAVHSDRQIMIAAGDAAGQGIYDVSSDAVPLVGTPVSSGDRWDMVVLRRHWASSPTDSATSLVLISGGPTKALPARSIGAGVEDDQPLWLARFTAGQAAVQDLIDLRCWHGDAGLLARDLLARDYLTRPGTRVNINGIWWLRTFDSTNNPVWVPDSVYVASSAPDYVAGLAWVKTP